jgi:hypothetical protein
MASAVVTPHDALDLERAGATARLVLDRLREIVRLQFRHRKLAISVDNHQIHFTVLVGLRDRFERLHQFRLRHCLGMRKGFFPPGILFELLRGPGQGRMQVGCEQFVLAVYIDDCHLKEAAIKDRRGKLIAVRLNQFVGQLGGGIHSQKIGPRKRDHTIHVRR